MGGELDLWWIKVRC